MTPTTTGIPQLHGPEAARVRTAAYHQDGMAPFARRLVSDASVHRARNPAPGDELELGRFALQLIDDLDVERNEHHETMLRLERAQDDVTDLRARLARMLEVAAAANRDCAAALERERAATDRAFQRATFAVTRGKTYAEVSAHLDAESAAHPAPEVPVPDPDAFGDDETRVVDVGPHTPGCEYVPMQRPCSCTGKAVR